MSELTDLLFELQRMPTGNPHRGALKADLIVKMVEKIEELEDRISQLDNRA